MRSPFSAWPALLLLTAAATQAQTVVLPSPDAEGWIRLFRGNNGGDFYSANNGDNPPAQSKLAFPGGAYSIVKGDTIQSAGNPRGQFYFKQSFAHYRVSYEMHFTGNTGNCGMLIHVQENDPTTNGFPRSVESQGDPNQGMGQIWPIGDVWVTIRARTISGRMTYDPATPEITYGGKDWGSRVVAGKDGWAKPDYAVLAKATGWVRQEVEVRGNDSVIDIVQDTVRIKYREPRVSSGGTPDNVTKRLSAGLIGWQSEGTQVWYRNLKVRLLPGDPLYKPVYAAWNAERAIRPKARRKILILEDGTLGLRDRGRETPRDALGRDLPKILLPTAP